MRWQRSMRSLSGSEPRGDPPIKEINWKHLGSNCCMMPMLSALHVAARRDHADVTLGDLEEQELSSFLHQSDPIYWIEML
jgi:hypothetical protein